MKCTEQSKKKSKHTDHHEAHSMVTEKIRMKQFEMEDDIANNLAVPLLELVSMVELPSSKKSE